MGKLLHRLARKEELTHVTERETDMLARTQVSHPVWENFVSCLFRKLSRQEKHLFNTFNTSNMKDCPTTERRVENTTLRDAWECDKTLS